MSGIFVNTSDAGGNFNLVPLDTYGFGAISQVRLTAINVSSVTNSP